MMSFPPSYHGHELTPAQEAEHEAMQEHEVTDGMGRHVQYVRLEPDASTVTIEFTVKLD